MKEKEPNRENIGRGRTVYLGGSIRGLTWEQATLKRHEARSLFEAKGFTVLDPMQEKLDFYHNGPIYLEGTDTKWTMEKIVKRDLRYLDHSDFHLVLTGDKPSWGTAIEMGYSWFVRKIPIVIVCKTEKSKKQGWHTYAAETTKGAVVDSLEEAVDWLCKKCIALDKEEFCTDEEIDEFLRNVGGLR